MSDETGLGGALEKFGGMALDGLAVGFKPLHSMRAGVATWRQEVWKPVRLGLYERTGLALGNVNKLKKK